MGQTLASKGAVLHEAYIFTLCFKRTVGLEGGYVNDPNDPGGATRYGVTESVARANGYQGAMQDFPLSMAFAIYWQDYWQPTGCPSFPLVIAYQLFDAAVNHGPTMAIKLLQQAVGVNSDGVMGPQTQSAVQALPSLSVAVLFLAQREQYYTTLSTWSDYGKGWSLRVVTNLQYAVEDAQTPSSLEIPRNL
ncbi:glycoside hydrolase family 108 protein [Pseudomonas chlororaphis]|uniref:glycoside hydrolase family 108 protein n=1 Tax=Pseudomonas chlororaphis TaxID=587753 RepID=UPI000BE36EC6|nr:glycosyl hydrolase 108 family protein [Pseudomonas chlororaphis]